MPRFMQNVQLSLCRGVPEPGLAHFCLGDAGANLWGHAPGLHVTQKPLTSFPPENRLLGFPLLSRGSGSSSVGKLVGNIPSWANPHISFLF